MRTLVVSGLGGMSQELGRQGVIALTMLAFLSACSGGSGGGSVQESATPLQPPSGNSVAPLTISPSSDQLSSGGTVAFTADGGRAPYSFAVMSGGGSIDALTGAFVAPAGPATVNVVVTDQTGTTATATIEVIASLALSPGSAYVVMNGAVSFSVSGGSEPFMFEVVSGGGSVSASGEYAAPAVSGAATVRVTDSLGTIADSTVTVVSAVSIGPSAFTLAINNVHTFTGSGGLPPYSYSVVSGSGSVSPVTGLYTAPASVGAAALRVTDSLGQTADAPITINPALTISPPSVSVGPGGSENFVGSGGVSPYSFSLAAGSGSVDSASGVYSAPGAAGSATVRVTDSIGNTSDAVVTISSPVLISPASITVATGGTANFSASGGTSPYSFSIVSGGGSMNSSSGAFTAPAGAGTVTVRVTDAASQTADATVTIAPSLGISPASISVIRSGSVDFSAVGGTAPFSFSIQSGGGSVNSTTGAYTAPASVGSATVRVQDSASQFAIAEVTIVDAVDIIPSALTLAVGNTATFSAQAGLAPYVFSIVTGGGTINSSTGQYTAPGTPGVATIRVTDALGQVDEAAVTINAALAISPSSADVVQNGALNFSASGGATPYSFSVVSGGGSVNSSTGAYTAPDASGAVTVRVTDSLGNTANAAVSVATPVAISPPSAILGAGDSTHFSASGGLGPYTFSLTAGDGSVNGSTGEYTAPGSEGSASVRVTDNLGQTADAVVTINAALAISPTTVTLVRNGTHAFSSSGGAAPRTYSVASGGGTVDSSTGQYTAPATAGSATVRVTDGNGGTADAAVTIVSAVSITPSSYALAVNNNITFTGNGGLAPYSFAVQSGGGSVNSSTGVYTAPASAGSATVRVTDSLGQTADATVAVNAALAISPASVSLAANGSQTFMATGGVAPLVFSVVSGGGSINSSTGAYTAPSTSAIVQVRVTDAVGNMANASVTVSGPLGISPPSATLAEGNTIQLSGLGGQAPYEFAMVSGLGTVDPSTGEYSAGGEGTDVVQVTDNQGSTANATITVVSQPSIDPTVLTISINDSAFFTASDGVPPRVYSVHSGVGTIGSSTGEYTAPDATGTATVRVTDSLGNFAEASVIVVAGLSITPASRSIVVNRTVPFSVLGGEPPYSFSIVSGGGTIDSVTGSYTAPATAQNVVVRVTDSIENTSEAMIEVVTPVQVYSSQSGSITCMKYSNSRLKCWGAGGSGRLGQGSTVNKGDNANEMFENLPYIELGSGFMVDRVSVGGSHVCATNTAGQLKCWGNNSSGQLGLGDMVARGGAPGEMGEALPFVNLGNGRTVLDITSGASHNCALLDNSTVKCWGLNSSGQLGQGNILNRGDEDGEMGDALAVTVLSSTATPTAIAAGDNHNCAILSNATMKCWGLGTNGRLGIGNANSMGDGTGEMGASLPEVNLGSGITPTFLALGSNFTCARVNGNGSRCWGANKSGQTMRGATNGQSGNIGDAAAEMGSGLHAMNFGTGRSVVNLVVGAQFGCALLDNGVVKCFGAAAGGALGNGAVNSNSNLGDAMSELGDGLPAVDLGSGLTVSSLAAGTQHVCALFSNHRLKCWGLNSSGQLGLGDTANRGGAANQMGENLLFVEF